jgi:hypothetical protein
MSLVKRRRHFRRALGVVATAAVSGVVALSLFAGANASPSSSQAGSATSCPGAPAQQALCEGLPATIPTLTPPNLKAEESPWASYAGTGVMPNAPISFTSLSTGWIVSGIGSSPSIDDHVSAGYHEQIWPGNEVDVTSDAGKTWQSVLSVPTGVWGLDTLTSTDVWAVGVSTLYQTTNGGQTWVAIDPSETPSSALLNVNFITPTIGSGITTAGGLVVTSDGGATWSSPSSSTNGSPMADECTDGANVLAATDGGVIWASSGASLGNDWSEVYTPPAGTDAITTASVLSCAPSGSAWEEVYPADASVSGGGLVVAESPAVGFSWQTAASVYQQGTTAPSPVIGPSNTGAVPGPSSSSWIPIVGSPNPTVIGSPNGDPNEPPRDIYESQDGIHFVPTSGTGPLFSSVTTPSESGGGTLAVYHGVSFDSSGDSWVYADVVSESSASASPSDVSLIYSRASGSSSWTPLFQAS